MTNAVVAICVVDVSTAAVGEVGAPVRAGLARGAPPKAVNAPPAVVEPVPPLVMVSVPASVMVPEFVIGPPEVVSPVVPPDTSTLITEPPPVMPRLVLASVAFVAPVPPWEMLNGVVRPVRLVIVELAPLVA